MCFKVAEDDMTFKLAIFKKSLPFNHNAGFCGILQALKLVLLVFIHKKIFFCPILNKNVASSQVANCGSGLPVEWPFHSQNAIKALDSPLPCGLRVKCLITHTLCFLPYSHIA